MTDYVKLGAILKAAREEADITQKAVAEILTVTASNVSSWERGKSRIDIESYIKLCHLYGINAVEPLAECSEDFTYPRLSVETPGQGFSDGSEFSYETEKSPSISDGDLEMLNMYHKLTAMEQGIILGEMRAFLMSDHHQEKGSGENVV